MHPVNKTNLLSLLLPSALFFLIGLVICAVCLATVVGCTDLSTSQEKALKVHKTWDRSTRVSVYVLEQEGHRYTMAGTDHGLVLISVDGVPINRVKE